MGFFEIMRLNPYQHLPRPVTVSGAFGLPCLILFQFVGFHFHILLPDRLHTFFSVPGFPADTCWYEANDGVAVISAETMTAKKTAKTAAAVSRLTAFRAE